MRKMEIKPRLKLMRRWQKYSLPPVLILAATSLAWLGLYLASEWVDLPAALLEPLVGNATLLDGGGHVVAELPTAAARIQHPCPPAELGTALPAALVALEDHRFYQHHGVDWHATLAAGWRNLRVGRVVNGASTLTQQLIKLSTPGRKRSLGSKIYENLAALKLERRWTKPQILAAYLDRVNFGNRLLGASAAAHAYFGKKPAHLTASEALFLAGLPQAPTRYNPWSHPAASLRRYSRAREHLLQQQKEAGLPSHDAEPSPADGGLSLGSSLDTAEALVIRPRRAPPSEAPHFTASLRQRRSLPGGPQVTTLNLKLQQTVTQLLRAHLKTLTPMGATHASAVVLDARTGAIRAMVGAADSQAPAGQINGTTAFRSAGSTLKPFLYLKATENRALTAASLLPDTQDAIRTAFPDYDPRNYDGRFLGPVRMREALACSLNVPAVVILSHLGPRQMFTTLQTYGLRFRCSYDAYGAGFILGNAEVRPLDLAAAFTAFVHDGKAAEPRWLESDPTRLHTLTAPEPAAIIADILCDNDARLRTFGQHSPLTFEGIRIPVKTGTSSGFRDAWTVGGTQHHVVAVWVGNMRGARMREVASISGAAPLWRSIIDQLLRDGDPGLPPPVESASLHRQPICQTTGLQPGKLSTATAQEWFLPGSEPRTSADTLLRATPDGFCLVLPSREYAVWCASASNVIGAEAAASTDIRIISPRADACYLIDPNIPATRQCLPLQAILPPGLEAQWEIDGQPVPQAGPAALWPLRPGWHHLQIRAGSHSQHRRFQVTTSLEPTPPSKGK